MSTKTVIIGQGYVGLPLSEAAVESGLSVVGLETNPATVSRLNSGLSHVDDVKDSAVRAMVDRGYRATTDVSCVAEADVVVICVPTPLDEAGGPDLGAVGAAARSISDNLTPGTLVILESTTYPGTTQEFVLPILEASGLQLDDDFYLAFSPERIDPGNSVYGLKNTPKVVGGVTQRSTDKTIEFYAHFVDEVVPVRGAKEAETAKLLENTYRHINIALVNEMVRFCHELRIDLWDVIGAAATKPFGFQAFYPGPGVGGHCIPIDPNYLSYEVQRTLGYPFRFVELAQEINSSMPKYVVDRTQDLLNEASKPLKGSTVVLLGVTYKPNIADQRESPAIPIVKILASKGANVVYHDPFIENWTPAGLEFTRVPSLDTAVREADIVVLLQQHSSYDADALAAEAKIFFDTKGVTKSDLAVRL